MRRKQIHAELLQRELSFYEGKTSTASEDDRFNNGGKDTGVRVGDLVQRLTVEADKIGLIIYGFLQRSVPMVLQLIGMLARMVVFSPILTVLTFISVPLMALVINRISFWLSRLSTLSKEKDALVASHLTQEINSMLEVKSLCGEAAMQRQFSQKADSARETAMSLQLRQSTFPAAITVVYGIIVLSLFIGGAYLVSTCSFTGGKLVGYLTSLVLLIEPLQALATTANELRDGEASMKRILELKGVQMDKASSAEPQIDSNRKVEHVELMSDSPLSFAFEGTSFSYSTGTRPILDRVDMHVAPGQKVILVGPSGGGKSTILKLLLRLYEPNSGGIKLNGYDLRAFEKGALREAIAVVPQRVNLFSGTVGSY